MSSFSISTSETIKPLRIAIQKSGRLKQGSLDYLQKAFGLSVTLTGNELVYQDTAKSVELIFLRDDDISTCVMNGDADVGIVGKNSFYEAGYGQNPYQGLGFSNCRLSLAIPNGLPMDVDTLNGKKIATSYPVILQDYLDRNDITASMRILSGSVELAPALGWSDAICDIVDTGGSLRRNNLTEVETIFESEAVLIMAPLLTDQLECDLADYQPLLEELVSLKNNMFFDLSEEDMFTPYKNYPWNCQRSFN